MSLAGLPTDVLWRYALAIVPVALLVAGLCRWLPLRPCTRHAMWLGLLLLLVVLPLLPAVPPVVGTLAGITDGMTDRMTDGNGPAALPYGTTLRSGRVLPLPEPALCPPAPPSIESAAPGPTSGLAVDAEAPSDEANLPALLATVPRAAVRPERRLDAIAGPRPTSATPGAAARVEPNRESKLAGAPAIVGATSPPAEPAPGAAPLEPTVAPSSDLAPGVFLIEARRWLDQLRAIRDAVMGLPPVPAVVWIGGTLLLLLALLLRRRLGGRLLRGTELAPRSVQRVVADAAARLRLERVPETFMTERRVSPLVWCGRRPRLLLPWPLWGQLDDLGRRAVVLHELAHLRRRDHWVRWVELVVGAVYWWHPVVWWIRRRLRDEADLCCDAWVTELLPSGRRAYAQALLETRRYLSNEPAPGTGLGLGLGAGTNRAKRFARRLTMVMTETHTPRLSLRGVLMCATLAGAACLALPVLACPPDEKPPAPPAKPLKLRLPAASRPLGRVEAPAPEGESTFEQFMRTRDRVQGAPGAMDDGDIEQRIRELERQIEQMQRRLQRTLEQELGPRPEESRGGVIRRVTPPTPPTPPAAPAPSGVPPMTHVPLLSSGPPAVPAPSAPMAGLYGHAGDEPDCAKVVARVYELPDGKLDDLVEIMVRADVPILVSPVEGGIEVHGNAAQHRAFAAFVKMIGEDKERRVRYTLSEGKLEGLKKLMARADVPIIIELQDDGIVVRGNDLEQMVFASFVKLLEPDESDASRPTGYGEAVGEYYQRAVEAVEAARGDGWRDGEGWAREARMAEMHAKLAEMEARREAIEAQREAVEEHAEMLSEQAEELADEAEELAEHADELAEQAEEAGGERGQVLRAEIRALREQARQMERQARQMERQAQQGERQLQQLEREAERLEQEAEKIAERIEELQEQAENRADSQGSR